MKTKLPASINTVDEAKKFLTELVKNDEAFHPEDDATDLNGDPFTREEGLALNKLMDEIYALPGNDGRHVDPMVFDPCEFILFETDKPRRQFVISWDETMYPTTDVKSVKGMDFFKEDDGWLPEDIKLIDDLRVGQTMMNTSDESAMVIRVFDTPIQLHNYKYK